MSIASKILEAKRLSEAKKFKVGDMVELDDLSDAEVKGVFKNGEIKVTVTQKGKTYQRGETIIIDPSKDLNRK